MDWPGVIALRDDLEAQLKSVITSRGIVPAIVRCSDCGHVGPGRAPSLTVRAVMFAANRFGLEPEESFRAMDKAWAKHRKAHQLDAQGRPSSATAADITHATGHDMGTPFSGLANNALHLTRSAIASRRGARR
jgi:hypothetical protein